MTWFTLGACALAFLGGVGTTIAIIYVMMYRINWIGSAKPWEPPPDPPDWKVDQQGKPR